MGKKVNESDQVFSRTCPVDATNRQRDVRMNAGDPLDQSDHGGVKRETCQVQGVTWRTV